MKGFEFDKEKAVVIGIALILLVAWGIWYPRQQARTAARNQERRAAIEAAAAKQAAAEQYAAAKQAEKQAAQPVKPETPARPEPVLPPAETLPSFTIANELTSFVIDPNTDIGTIAEQNGFGVKCLSNDADGFVNGVAKLLNADMQKMGEQGFQSLNEMFAVERAYGKILGSMVR